MKVFVITLFAVAFLSADASPKPGGYTLKGGVDKRYIYDKPEGYYRPAQNAGRFAQQQKLEDEFQSQGLGFGTLNSKRSVAAQPVTFFTSHANHAALTALAQNNAHQEQQFHTKREVYEKPLYYNEHPQHSRR